MREGRPIGKLRIGHAYGGHSSGMLFARLKVCHLQGCVPLKVFIERSFAIERYLKKKLDILEEVRTLRLATVDGSTQGKGFSHDFDYIDSSGCQVIDSLKALYHVAHRPVRDALNGCSRRDNVLCEA